MKVCAKKNVKNAKKISVSLRECGIFLGAGTILSAPTRRKTRVIDFNNSKIIDKANNRSRKTLLFPKIPHSLKKH